MLHHVLVTGEDGRMIGWDPIEGKYLCDYHSNGMMFDVQWSPHLPSVLSAYSLYLRERTREGAGP